MSRNDVIDTFKSFINPTESTLSDVLANEIEFEQPTTRFLSANLLLRFIGYTTSDNISFDDHFFEIELLSSETIVKVISSLGSGRIVSNSFETIDSKSPLTEMLFILSLVNPCR